jgi:hypothetical protein
MKSANRGALIGGLIGLAAGMALEAAYPTNAQGSSRALGPFLLGGLGGGWLGKSSARRLKKGELIYSIR